MKYMCCKKVIALLISISCFCLEFGTAIDTITSAHFINDSGSIVSSESFFKLGFFSPENSTNRYVGIWYNKISVCTVIWVANRNRPLKDSSGILKISDDGNLLVLNGQKEILWSSNISRSTANSSAQLLETGNLVLQDVATGQNVWESFQEPTDSYMQKMKLSTNKRTKVKVVLTSWKSPSDPSTGNFSQGIDSRTPPEVVIWKGNQPYWRSGPWNRQTFIGVPQMSDRSYYDGIIIGEDDDGTVYMTNRRPNTSLLKYRSLTSQGTFEGKYWDVGTENWVRSLVLPSNDCDVYGKCGAFGSCDQQSSPICSCLKGYVPYSKNEWKRGNWTSGCVRRKPLQCERVNSGGEKGKEDGFLKLNMVKVPAFVELNPALEDQCRNVCLSNCSCIAYAYYSGLDCMIWSGNLIDIQKFSGSRVDLYIRLAHSELDNERNREVIITTTVLLGAVTIAICAYYLWGWITKERGSEKSDETSMLNSINQIKFQDLPLFKFEKLLAATNNFHPTNKLGQGGFGSVYWGKLQDGQEIAVKRLSRASGQGLEEFMNEVIVISKLQHRNLVRLLGCCIDGEEKMLVYEYMPNKSFDSFLFVHSNQPKYTLNWSKLFNIIEGITRGLLYLHRDSRLRIIHRDLKASNILLDEEMNPKISDFGTARIFAGNENQANTKRVVGTYGYMSPEYVMEGRFSEKSDVFSFGVLLLEIVSGRRNSSFYHDDQSLSLLGFAWKLWNEDNIDALIDPTIYNESFLTEILRCIHVGLLCVQEFAKDRPSVSTILSMLKSETLDLPSPKQPAFTDRKFSLDAESPINNSSVNNDTVTILEGR